MTSTGRYEFYPMFLENNNFNSNNKILACFSFLKSIKIRFLVLIIRYVLKNPVYLSLLPSPLKMYASDLGLSQSPGDTWTFVCLLALEVLTNMLAFTVQSSTVIWKLLLILLLSLLIPGIAQNLNHSALS